MSESTESGGSPGSHMAFPMQPMHEASFCNGMQHAFHGQAPPISVQAMQAVLSEIHGSLECKLDRSV